MPTLQPLPGQVLRASMLSQPWRARGELQRGTGLGTDFAAVTNVQQFEATGLTFEADRLYRFDYQQLWGCTAANQTNTYQFQVDPGTGVYAVEDVWRSSNTAIAVPVGSSTECVSFFRTFAPGVNVSNGRIKLTADRWAGAGTSDMNNYDWCLSDVGAA